MIDFPIRPPPTKNGDRPDGGSLDKYMGHFIKSWINADGHWSRSREFGQCRIGQEKKRRALLVYSD